MCSMSASDGRVAVDWHLTNTDAQITLNWVERDGPPVKAPLKTGFGSTLIQHGFAEQLGGSARLSFEPNGLVCTLEFPRREPLAGPAPTR